ncbi:PREDICTED: uncharacterized protein LOC105970535 [Erythranthe guttata]|uniref:uncharacterized protein LOC105970535 n=1 Tax=Erythranthe guttata TaxID=4155 RepID=UPI00064DAA55|nr:PREDICTED: uncharacterized protein LOC105970535 [Erythranthe guttata]|eukprot:XP_012850824.1 PREDICTED: uncharacterized protein LOC105970535 [Erythranthe guttata]
MKARLTREIPHWEEYIQALNSRFGTLLFEDPMSELMNLKQTGPLQDFLDQFDVLMNSVDLSETQAVSCFLGGVEPEIAIPIRIFKPKTMMEVVRLAKLQEQSMEMNSPRKNTTQPPIRATYTHHRPNPLPLNRNPTHTPHFQPPKPHHNPHYSPHILPKPNNYPPRNPSMSPNRRIPNQDLDERRAKGLCFWCDEKYSRDHHCPKRRQMYVMEIGDEEGSPGSELESHSIITSEDKQEWEGDEPISHVSVHAITRAHDFKTMRLKGSARGKTIRILIDNGATHNFIDLETAKLLGCKLMESKPFSVTVAGGNRLRSQYKCIDFVWKIHGVEFTADVMTLPLGTCDLVLGIHWLTTLGDIVSNYQELKMEFNYGGRKVMLRGLHQNNVKMVSNKKTQ